MSDRPKTSDGLPEDPDPASEQDGVNGDSSAAPKPTDSESNGRNPGPHQEQGGMHS